MQQGKQLQQKGCSSKPSLQSIATHPCAATYSTFLAALGTTLQGWGGVE